MDKFQEYNLNIQDKEKNLVLEYLEKIKNYINKNNIEKELYNDIEEMVFEKLSQAQELNQLKVLKILKEVGEPEIIFSDYVETKKIPEEKKSETKVDEELFYEKLIKNGWYRDNSDAIFLGVSKVIAEKTGSNIWIIRLLIFLFFFAGGISAWIYILLGVILPVKGENYKGLSNFLYFRVQTYAMVKDLIYNTANSLQSLIKFIFINSFGIMKSMLSFIIDNIFPIIRFFIFSFLAFLFAIVLFGLIVGGAAYFSGFSIENVEFTSSLPNYFIRGILFGIISASILTIASFLYGLNKKVLNSYILSLAGISFLIALFLGISTGFELVKKYSMRTEFTQSTKLENIGTGEYIIDLERLRKSKIMGELYNVSSIKLENSTGNTVEVKIINKIFGNEEISKKVTDGLNKISLEKNGNSLIVTTPNNNIFGKKVPFSVMEREIVLYVPKDIKFSVIPSYNYYFENVFLDKSFEKYGNYLRNNCSGQIINYSENEKKFVCKVEENDLKSAKEEYLKDYVMENFDKISTLKHKERYKRDYYNNHGNINDWNFENIEFKDDKTLNIDFSDMSLKIYARVNVSETSSGVLVENFKINDAEIMNPENFQEKYYEDVTPIKDFIDLKNIENYR